VGNQPQKAPKSAPKGAPKTAPKAAPAPDPNGPVNVALLGARGHGRKHLDAFLADPLCRVGYICDVDLAVGTTAAKHAKKRSGLLPNVVQDFREALADEAVDAVSIALPHHWHAPAAIWALQAGKHVYLEKPTTHVHSEAAPLEAAHQKHPGFVQAGTQLRSNTGLQRAAEFMQSGGIGDIDLVHCITYKPRASMPDTGPAQIPPTVDYDMWCGPAEKTDPTRSRFHYHWHWFWEFGNGALGNNGIHRMDVARIGLGLEGLGDEVLSFGGRFGPADAGETPNSHIVIHRFGDTWVVHEIIGMPTGAHLGIQNGVVFHGSTGAVAYVNGKTSVIDDRGEVVQAFTGRQDNHYTNFLEAVTSRDETKIAGNLAESNISSSLCHLGNISYRTGETAADGDVDAAVDAMGAPPEVQRMRSRLRLNVVANGENGDFVLGRRLDLGDMAAPIVNDAAAERLLTKSYRDPYGVPAADQV